MESKKFFFCGSLLQETFSENCWWVYVPCILLRMTQEIPTIRLEGPKNCLSHSKDVGSTYGCFLKWWYPQDTPK